ncbi:hypothetical protein [Leptospira sp. GIMC2001]|uniref:hypothetical protein n=1 Tax=Leptospira sp. GIMC2001 TaxID=1513297 RepID=UPI0023499B9A|nr:hypothetical protein [Leptospira sp. GIMC2001]WCL49189.1 hypothetical protein O4O04_18135 [Leptospira sp. GIMC2001]
MILYSINKMFTLNVLEKIFFLLIIGLVALSCDQFNKKEDNSVDELITSAILLDQLNPSLYDCSGTNWNFEAFLDSGPRTVCTQCHNDIARTQGLVITDYSLVRNRVVPGNPTGSLLYIKITEGNMRAYATSSIQRGAYCWIRAGAQN